MFQGGIPSYPPNHAVAVDRVKEALGQGPQINTGERKAAQKQQRLAYGAELQAQMAEREEAKRREKMERMGIPMPPPHQGYGPPPPGHAISSFPPQPAHQGYGNAYSGFSAGPNPSFSPGMPQPSFMGGMPPSFAPGSPGRGPPSPGRFSPPPMGPAPGGFMHDFQGPPGYGQPAPAHGGYGAPLTRANSDNVMQRAAQQAKKDQYRMELEAQMRAKDERKKAEKMASMEEDRRRQAPVAYDFGGAFGRGGGGGAPLRDPMGNVVSDLNAMRGYNQARDREQLMGMQQPGPYMNPGPLQRAPSMSGPSGYGPPSPGGYGPPSPGGHMSMGMPPPAGPGGFSAPPGMDGGPPQFASGPSMEGMHPHLRFRSDNPYITHAELDAKQRQRLELQDALQRQIAEKKYKKDLEKQQELDLVMREEARMKADQEKLKNQFQEERHREHGGDGKTAEERVAEAWAKAKQDTEDAKRRHFEDRRKNRQSGDDHAAGMHAEPQTFSPGPPPAPATFHTAPDPPAYAPRMDASLNRSSTPMGAEKVKKLAQEEIQRVREELNAEAAKLHQVVEEQSQQVAALKQHAVRMEQEAADAKDKVNKMRVDMIRTSLAAPESMMRMLSDYPMHPHAEPPPSLLDIALDLPPPAAVLRRSQPIYDMGPVLPAMHNPATVMDRAAQNAIHGVVPERPPTQGMRTINPLEQSMAAESVFIYPNGRELPRDRMMNQLPQAAAQHLPFKSIILSEGLQGHSSHLEEHGNGVSSPSAIPSSSTFLPADQPLNATSSSIRAPDMPGHHANGYDSQGSHQASGMYNRSGRGSEGGRRHDGGGPLATPLDVDTVMQQNKNKLQMLQELNHLNANDSIEAIDDFLVKFAKTSATMPERGGTPVFRVNTPSMPSPSGHYNSTGPSGPHISGPGPVPESKSGTPLLGEVINNTSMVPGPGLQRTLSMGANSTVGSRASGGGATQTPPRSGGSRAGPLPGGGGARKAGPLPGGGGPAPARAHSFGHAPPSPGRIRSSDQVMGPLVDATLDAEMKKLGVHSRSNSRSNSRHGSRPTSGTLITGEHSQMYVLPGSRTNSRPTSGSLLDNMNRTSSLTAAAQYPDGMLPHLGSRQNSASRQQAALAAHGNPSASASLTGDSAWVVS